MPPTPTAPPAASARPARTWGSALITWSTTTRSSPPGSWSAPSWQTSVPTPSDLQVVAIAPRETTLLGTVEYTAVEIPVDEIGQAAVAAATELIEGADDVGDQLIAPSLIERDTTHPLTPGSTR